MAKRRATSVVRWAALCAAGVVGVLSPWTLAQGLDLDSPNVVVVASPGTSWGDRLDARRTGRSPTALPIGVETQWRYELRGGLEHPPLVDTDGGVFASLTSAELEYVDARGNRQWRLPLGGKPAAVAPVLRSDGSVFLVTDDGYAWSIDATGKLLFRVALNASPKRARATPLPLRDGSVVIALPKQAIHLGRDGKVRARTQLQQTPVGGVLAHGRGFVLTGEHGAVHLWQPPALPRKRADFGGKLIGGGVLVGVESVAAVVGKSRLEVADLRTGERRLLFAGSPLGQAIEGPPTFDNSGTLLVSTVAGELFGVDAAGVIRRKRVLDPGQAGLFMADAGVPVASLFRQFALRVSPPLIVDSAGRIGFVRSSGRVGVVDGERIIELSSRICGRPLAVVPGGPQRLLLACANGSLVMFGGEALER